MKNITVISLGTLALLASGCGGGGGSGSSDASGGTTAEGIWTGSTSSNRAIAGVVLDNGEFWFVYSAQGNDQVVGGLVQGTGTSNNGNYRSTNGRNFNLEGAGTTSFSMNANYVEKSTLLGTLTSTSSGNDSFDTSYDADYDLTPSLSKVSGNYSGEAATSGGVETASVTISNNGAVTSSSASGCNGSGNVSVRPSGNVYNVTITFQGGVCANGTNTVTGVAYFDESSSELTSAGLNSQRTDGFIFLGSKP